jgi:hypothetical protein
MPFMPPEQFGKPVAGLILVWAGDPAASERAIAPLRRIGTPIADGIRPIPYVALQSMLDGGAPHGRHYYWKAHRLPTLTDEVIDIFIERIGSMTSPFAQINGWAVGGAVRRVDADATAVGDEKLVSRSAWRSAGRPPIPTGNATVLGPVRGGRRSGRTATASTRTSSRMRAQRASGPPTASASRDSPRSRTGTTRRTSSG